MNGTRAVGILSLLLQSLLGAGCITEVPADNPYDPEAPLAEQAKATLAGGVVDGATSAPLQGALVRVSGPSDPAANPAVTGDDGSFNFGEVLPGRYVLDVSHPQYYRIVCASSISWPVMPGPRPYGWIPCRARPPTTLATFVASPTLRAQTTPASSLRSKVRAYARSRTPPVISTSS